MTHGRCRVLVGDFMEEATAAISGGKRLKTDSTKVTCPDVQISKHRFLESKSIGLSGKAIIYEERLKRDFKFCSAGRELFYCFWSHRFKVSQAESKAELHKAIKKHLVDVVIVPFDVLWSIYSKIPAKLLNNAYTKNGKRIGWGSNGHSMGWNVSIKQLRGLCHRLGTIHRIEVYGAVLENVPVFLHPLAPASWVTAALVEQRAEMLLEELQANRLEVMKWPSRDGYVRGCVSKNAEWYSHFCRRYTKRHSRRYPKHRTYIKRVDIVRALGKIIKGPDFPHKYAYKTLNVERLLEFMEDWF